MLLDKPKKTLISLPRTTHKLPCCLQMKQAIIVGSPQNYIKLFTRDKNQQNLCNDRRGRHILDLTFIPCCTLPVKRNQHPRSRYRIVGGQRARIQPSIIPKTTLPTTNRPTNACEIQQPTKPNIVISKDERQNDKPEHDLFTLINLTS